MKITILSKPEEKTSSKGTKYWQVKVKDEKGEEKHGSIFGKIVPEIDGTLEVEEKYNDQYQSYSWFQKEDKKAGFASKPSLTVDQQIRVNALQYALQFASGRTYSSDDLMKMTRYFETYIREGKS